MDQTSDRISGGTVAGRRPNRARMWITLAAAAAVIGYVIFRILAAGDEPPIRVKNGGSVHLTLETSASKWEPVPGTNEWTHDGDPFPNPVFWAFVTPSNHSCDAVQNPVRRVQITTNDGEVLTFGHDPGKRPRIAPQPGSALHLDSNDNTLLVSRGTNRFVARIELWRPGTDPEPDWACNFTSTQLDNLLLCPKQSGCP